MKLFLLTCLISLMGFSMTACSYHDYDTQHYVTPQDLPVQQHKPGMTLTPKQKRKIQTGDVLILRVVPGAEFENELDLTVNLDGEVLVPLIGWVHVEDLTPEEAAEAIRKPLDKDFLVDPSVSVRLKEASTRAVVLLGQLKKPGTYEFPPNGKMSLLEAVAKAEGFTDIANISKIKVVRTMLDGSQVTIRVDAGKIISGEEPDLGLQESDLITVPESLF